MRQEGQEDDQNQSLEQELRAYRDIANVDISHFDFVELVMLRFPFPDSLQARDRFVQF